MEQGLFFDGIAVAGNHLSIYKAEECSGTIFPNSTKPFFSVLDQAVMAAQDAANLIIFSFFVQIGLFHLHELLGCGSGLRKFLLQ